jgi:PAS domain S-box-containing protein
LSLGEAGEPDALYRRVMELSPDGIAVADDTGRILDANTRLAEMLGFSPQDLRTTNLQQLLAPERRAGAPLRLDEIRTDTPLLLVRRVRRKDGTWFDAETSLCRLAPARVVSVVRGVSRHREVERELNRLQRRLSETERLAHVASWEWNIENDQLWWSDEAFQILGLPRGFAVSLGAFLALVHPDDREGVARAMRAAASSRSEYNRFHRVVRPDGLVRLIRARGDLHPAPGQPRRMLGTLQDATEARKAEETLAFLSSAVVQTADSVFITDRSGRILYANPACAQQTGFGAEELVGQTSRLFRSGVHTPEFYKEFWQAILSGQVFRGTFVNRRKDGAPYYEEKTVGPIRDADGNITHFVSTGRDVGERRRAEETQNALREALRKSADEWRATFDAVDSPLLVLDANGRVHRPNRAAQKLSGKPYPAMIGVPVEEAGQGPLWRAFADAVSQALRDCAPASAQVSDPETGKTWDVGVSVLDLPEFEGTGAIVFARDVTAIVDLQESLRSNETVAAMGRLVAGVAHEVRNPLFGISATLDAFEAQFGARAEYLDYGRQLRGEVERLSELMQDLLDYGKPIAPHLVPAELGALLERACRGCEVRARIAGVTLTCSVPTRLPALSLDRSRIVQVFQNLVDNAVQHSPAGSHVTVSAEDLGEAIECRVLDSGPGFTEEDRARAFEPFYTRRRGGTGLGLAIAQRIVYEHGGTIAVSNAPEGGGLIHVRLPVASAREASE